MKNFTRKSLLASWMIAAATAPLFAQQNTTAPQGLDALDEKRVMAELANRGLDTLLKREFEVQKVPAAQQMGISALADIRQLSDPVAFAKLDPKDRQRILNETVRGVAAALPVLNDPKLILQLANTLVSSSVDPDVNSLEYWGENPRTQERLKPVIETVLKGSFFGLRTT